MKKIIYSTSIAISLLSVAYLMFFFITSNFEIKSNYVNSKLTTSKEENKILIAEKIELKKTIKQQLIFIDSLKRANDTLQSNFDIERNRTLILIEKLENLEVNVSNLQSLKADFNKIKNNVKTKTDKNQKTKELDNGSDKSNASKPDNLVDENTAAFIKNIKIRDINSATFYSKNNNQKKSRKSKDVNLIELDFELVPKYSKLEISSKIYVQVFDSNLKNLGAENLVEVNSKKLYYSLKEEIVLKDDIIKKNIKLNLTKSPGTKFIYINFYNENLEFIKDYSIQLEN